MRNLSLNFMRLAQPLSGLPVNPIGAYPRCAGKRASRWLWPLLLLLCASLTGCSKPAPEQALRDRIEQMAQAAVNKDASALFDHFAEDFAGSGGMDRDNFRRYVQLIWLQQKDIGVKTGPLNVKLMGERATVDFTVVLTGGQGFIPDDGRIYQVQTGWRLEGDEWKLISATWK